MTSGRCGHIKKEMGSSWVPGVSIRLGERKVV